MRQLLTKLFFLAFALGFLFTGKLSAQEIGTTTKELCQAVNSINIYESGNLKKVQNFLKQSYFNKTRVTGINDLQTKFYIGRFQYAFGLKLSGTLNAQTIKFLKNQNKCFDLESRVVQIESSTPTKKVEALDLVSEILRTYVYPTSSTTVQK